MNWLNEWKFVSEIFNFHIYISYLTLGKTDSIAY